MYSICILFYNEYPTIVNFALRVNKFMGEVLGGNYEIILIDDCSTDLPEDELLKNILGSKIRVVHHKRNLGYAFATRSAIEESVGEHIIILDGDGEYPEENILKFIAEISPNVSLMLPLRDSRHKNWKRRIASRLLTILCRVLLQYPEKDINGGAKYINSNFKSHFKIEYGLNLVNPELWTIAHRNNLIVKFIQVNFVENSDNRESKILKKPHKLAFIVLFYILRLKNYYNRHD